jgi:hypothetical protein
MHFISAQIVRFADAHQPGWVECEFVDAEGRRHIIVEKVPVLTSKDLGADSKYPTLGSVPCEILRRYQDEAGQELARVSTARPANIATKEGLSEFTVFATFVTSVPN